MLYIIWLTCYERNMGSDRYDPKMSTGTEKNWSIRWIHSMTIFLLKPFIVNHHNSFSELKIQHSLLLLDNKLYWLLLSIQKNHCLKEKYCVCFANVVQQGSLLGSCFSCFFACECLIHLITDLNSDVHTGVCRKTLNLYFINNAIKNLPRLTCMCLL